MIAVPAPWGGQALLRCDPRPALLVLSAVLSSGGAAQDDQWRVGTLHSAAWRLDVLGRTLAGDLAWIGDDPGRWRVEIGLDPDGADNGPRSDARLLARRGDGWTLIVDADTGTLGRWHEEWRVLEPGQADWACRMLESLTALMGNGPITSEPQEAERGGADPGRPRWLGGTVRGRSNEQTIRFQASPPDREPPDQAGRSSFHRRLAWRGRGRGGLPELWALTRAMRPTGCCAVRISSSRRPGAVVLSGFDMRSVEYPDPETFLPLWSLEEMGVGRPPG